MPPTREQLPTAHGVIPGFHSKSKEPDSGNSPIKWLGNPKARRAAQDRRKEAKRQGEIPKRFGV